MDRNGPEIALSKMPARLADGLGLESDRDAFSTSFAPTPGLPEEIGSPASGFIAGFRLRAIDDRSDLECQCYEGITRAKVLYLFSHQSLAICISEAAGYPSLCPSCVGFPECDCIVAKEFAYECKNALGRFQGSVSRIC
jgi:hypothetical protein